jgi:hypothetical protein
MTAFERIRFGLGALLGFALLAGWVASIASAMNVG